MSDSRHVGDTLAEEKGGSSPSRVARWSGERYLPWLPVSSIHHEHLHRYRLALDLASGARVLDIACGEGYGTALLATTARLAVGLDIDAPTVRHAARKYRSAKVVFVHGDATALPFPDSAFDLVVCFEALEHVRDPERMLAEIGSLLGPGGVLLLSTPNKRVYTDIAEATAPNPFHRREFYHGELSRMLSRHFRHARVFGQHVFAASSVFRLDERASRAAPLAVRRGPAGYDFVPARRRPARYFVAVASDSDSARLDLGESTLFDLSGGLVDDRLGCDPPDERAALLGHLDHLAARIEEVVGQMTEAVSANDADQDPGVPAALQATLVELSREQELSAGAVRRHEREMQSAHSRIGILEAQLSEARGVLAGVLGSRSWRLTEPLRSAVAAGRLTLGRPGGTASLDVRHAPGRTGGRYGLRPHAEAPNALVIDHDVLRPDCDAGSLRLERIIDMLRARGYGVDFYAARWNCSERRADSMRERGINVAWKSNLPNLREHLAACGARYDVVWLSRAPVADRFLDLVRTECRAALVVFDTVDLHHVRELRQSEIEGSPELAAQASTTRSMEMRLARAADITVVVSDTERRVLLEEVPDARIEILPTIYEVCFTDRGFDSRAGLLFVGGYHHRPNVDAVGFFVDRILPAIVRENPAIRFTALGAHAPPELLGRTGGNVAVPGWVPDLVPWLESSRIFVCPLRYGAGVKGKICQAMAHGLPVVATPVAVEGMPVAPGKEVLIAETPEHFARTVLDLYRSPVTWSRLSSCSQAAAARHYSPDVARNCLGRILATRQPRASCGGAPGS